MVFLYHKNLSFNFEKIIFMKFDFRPAREIEVLQISLLMKQVYLESYAIEGVTKLFADFITEQFSIEKITSELNSKNHEFWVATCNENPIGVLKISFGKKCPLANTKSPEVNKLYLMKRFSGQGIGKQLMQAGEQSLKSKGFEEVWLEVWTKNEGAIGFYKKNGYKILGEVWFSIENKRYLNYVMVKNL